MGKDLFFAVLDAMRGRADEGIPRFVTAAPLHLRRYVKLFAAPSWWSKLIGVQHDEKDIHRVAGPAGLQDWGDGEAKAKLDALEAAKTSSAAAVSSLRKLAPTAAVGATPYRDAVVELRARVKQLEGYSNEATVREARLTKKVVALRRKEAKIPAGDTAQTSRVARHIAYNTSQTDRISSTKALIEQLSADASKLPPAPAAGYTAVAMINFIERAQKLLGPAFDLANSPASKVLAMVTCSVLNCDQWGVGATYYTADEATTWQMREAVLRTFILSYEKLGLIPVFVGADKAYYLASHWDLEGYAKTRTAALKEVEYMSRITPHKGGYYDVQVKNWPRTADLQAAAEACLAHPAAVANGVVRQPWMDDFVMSKTREVRGEPRAASPLPRGPPSLIGPRRRRGGATSLSASANPRSRCICSARRTTPGSAISRKMAPARRTSTFLSNTCSWPG